MVLSKHLSIFCLVTLLVVTFSFVSAQNLDSETKNKVAESKKTKELKIFNNNRYISIPSEVFELVNLQILSFSGSECDVRPCVNISKLPPEIKKLRDLRHLSLVMNNLKSLPNEINSMQLESLDLSSNLGIDVSNLNVKSLKNLNLNECGLKTLPRNILMMKNLTVLGIEGNAEISESEINLIKEKLPNCTIYWK